MKTIVISAVLGFIYGTAMAVTGVDFQHPGFWVGAAFGVLMAVNHSLWEK